jgi:hypothetical protein
VELFNIHDECSSKDGFGHRSSTNRRSELDFSEYRSEVMWICLGVAAIPLFWVDVPTASKGIGLGSESSGTESDDKVKLGKVFGPSDLSASKEFRSREVFQILVISDDVNWENGTFKIVSPDLKGFENGQKFLIVNVII